MTQLRIIFLGTAAATPTNARGLSSTAILRGDELLLFDAGEGIQHSLSRSGLGLNRRTKIFITHMHGDHCIGLLGLLQTMAMNGREKPVEIIGPEGAKRLVQQTREILGFGLTYPVYFTRTETGVVAKEEDYIVRACRTEHNIESYAYCLHEFPRPGVFRKEAAQRLGIPEGELWSNLQHGMTVQVGGKRILPRQVLGPKRPGRKIGLSGDTRPTPSLARFFKGCSVLIFDSTYGDEHASKAVENMHSTAREAAMVAREAEVGLLVLTHFSARYTDVSPLLTQAAEVHQNVISASDQLAIEVPYPEETVSSGA